MGIAPKGSTPARVREQIERLLDCKFKLIYESEHGEQFTTILFADRGEFSAQETASVCLESFMTR